jgi:hypothetical protein
VLGCIDIPKNNPITARVRESGGILTIYELPESLWERNSINVKGGKKEISVISMRM